MPFNEKTYPQFVSDQVTTWAALMGLSPNLPSGDPYLAMAQAAALGGFIFLQSQGKQIYNFARASTASGADLDSYMADFGFFRLQPTQADGQVLFTLPLSASQNTVIPVGTIVQTAGGTQFKVIADTTEAGYSSSLGAYIIVAGQTSVTATVQAVNAGSASNVQTGQIVQVVTSGIPVSNVTNLAPLNNGDDAESDADFRMRFILAFNSKNAEGTQIAILSAAKNVQQNLDITTVENVDINGNSQRGEFLVVVDDGSGFPPSGLITSVYNAVFAVRGFTIEPNVAPPDTTLVTAHLNVKVDPNAANSQQTVLTNVTNAIINYINTLKIGDPLYIEKLSQIAQNADPGVLTVQSGSILIQGAATDLASTIKGLYRTNNLKVTVGTF